MNDKQAIVGNLTVLGLAVIIAVYKYKMATRIGR